jgi:hypothetical protein
MDEYQKLMQILQANANKTFVQRILRPDDFPVLPHDGGIATHRMAWGDAGGKFYAYPTVLFDGKNLKDYGDAAWDHAVKSGNVIEFPSAQEAEWFTKRYKEAWGGKKGYMQEWERNRFANPL